MKPSELSQAIRDLATIRQPFFIWGDPGVGKSQIVQQVADDLFAGEAGYEMVLVKGREKKRKRVIERSERRPWLRDLRAVLLDPVDLMGIPEVVKGRTRWSPPEILPHDERTNGLLFFDELNRAPVMVQNACLQLVLDRRLGEYHLPKGWVQGAAGNFESEGGVQRMPDALRSRFVHLEAEAHLGDFIQHATKTNFDPAVVAFVQWKPELLHKYERKAKRPKEENGFPCPRTWEFVSRVIGAQSSSSSGVRESIIRGTIGAAAGNEFISFLRMYNELPDLNAIIREPLKVDVPTSPATCYAVAVALARRAEPNTLPRILSYMDRFPEQEYSVVCVRDILERTSLEMHPAMTEWKIRHSNVLL